MIRLAYDHQVFAQQRFGGISRYFVELASRLPSLGDFDVTVVAPFHQNEHLAASAVTRRITLRKLTRRRMGIKRAMRWGNALSLPLIWDGRSFDIIHETYFSATRRGHCRRRLLTVYDMIHELIPDELPQSDSVLAAKRAAVARADHIICISETTRRDLIRLLQIDPARTSVIYLGHSLTRANADDPTADAPARMPDLLYVGDRSSYKNFAAAVEAYAATPRLRDELRFVAFGSRPFSERELRRFEELRIADRIVHASGDDSQLADHYRQARFFICPSLYEGFGLPPLEAMAHGCPVACSNRGSLPEIVDNAAELFDPSDREQMAAAMERLAFDDARCRELATLGRQRAAQFTWEKCAADTAALYRRLL